LTRLPRTAILRVAASSNQSFNRTPVKRGGLSCGAIAGAG